MKSAILKLRIIFIMGCICIALGIILLGMDIQGWPVILGLGIYFMGFWAVIMVVNPDLKDFGDVELLFYDDLLKHLAALTRDFDDL